VCCRLRACSFARRGHRRCFLCPCVCGRVGAGFGVSNGQAAAAAASSSSSQGGHTWQRGAHTRTGRRTTDTAQRRVRQCFCPSPVRSCGPSWCGSVGGACTRPLRKSHRGTQGGHPTRNRQGEGKKEGNRRQAHRCPSFSRVGASPSASLRRRCRRPSVQFRGDVPLCSAGHTGGTTVRQRTCSIH
jgi:hypothetical protein